MIRGNDIFRNIGASLTLRVILLLTLTMAPIGAIAVYQTSRLSDTLNTQAEDAAVSATARSATPSLVALERAKGAASAVLLTSSSDLLSNPDCRSAFERAISPENGYRFAGLLTDEGVVCLSNDEVERISAILDGTNSADLAEPFLVQKTNATGDTAIIIGQPVVGLETERRFVLLEPVELLSVDVPASVLGEPFGMLIVGRDGAVLAASESSLLETEIAGIAGLLQQNRGEGVVLSEAPNGVERAYALAPLSNGLLTGISIWPQETFAVGGVGARIAPWVFPIMMWLATLAITYVAINRLVVRHVGHLGRRMRRFARNRTLPSTSLEGRQPFEFSEMEANFRHMAEVILRDEAELEAALKEKTLLLREVHHRVKNNLQLIASIMNMQIRKCHDDETNEIVRRLQDRVLGLAAVHREMYEADALDRVPADRLVHAILEQTVSLHRSNGLMFTSHLDPVDLLPDQAVPLSLLTAELATNALTYATSRESGETVVDVRLALEKMGEVTLSVSNSTGLQPSEAAFQGARHASGLGTQLVDAFVRQLGGSQSTEVCNGVYQTEIRFRPTAVSVDETVDGRAAIHGVYSTADAPPLVAQ